MRKLVTGVVRTVVIFLFVSLSYAGIPLWTFTPDANYPPKQTVTPNTTAKVKYTIINQSPKTHTLKMKAIPGVTQVTSGGSCASTFTLGYKQSCVLYLLVNGRLLNGDIKGGPIVCQTGSTFECYQPSPTDALALSLKPVVRYLITPIAGENGAITPGTPQTVVTGATKVFQAKPSTGYQVDQWLLDGGIVQKGGSTFTLSNIDKNHTVEVTFARQGTLFVGMKNGFLYFSTDNGLIWTHAKSPSSGNAVNSIFATETTLYAGSADGKVI